MATKRKPISGYIKLQALDEVDRKVKSKSQNVKQYGVLCSTLSTWLKNKEALRLNYLCGLEILEHNQSKSNCWFYSPGEAKGIRQGSCLQLTI